MSKSAPDASSRILLTDLPDTITAKIRVAVTDSVSGITYDPVARPGTANLLTILAACTEETPEDVALRYANKNHGHLKKDVVEAVAEKLRPAREEFERIRVDKAYLETVAQDGARRAAERSGKTMKMVREAIGLS